MRKIFLTSFVALGTFFNAQTIGNSPYAAFGLGDVKYDNTIDISAMGGVSTAYINDFNNKFNFNNPAANTNLGLTSISIEATNENNFFKSNYQDIKSKKHSTYLSNISIAFPISKKVKFGMGYQPYSSKSYDIKVSKNLDNNIIQANSFSGKGTVSTVQVALGYSITDDFALGLRTNYYFGKIYDTEQITFSNAEFINGFENGNKVSVFNFTAGTTYQKKLENNRKLTFGATYTFETVGEISSSYKNSTYYRLISDENLNETIIDERKSDNKNFFPQQASLGLGYGNDGKWFYSAQVDYKKGETIQYLGKPFQYEDSYRIAAGGWILPNYNNFRNYFSRVIYKFGAYYEKGNLNITPTGTTTATNVNQFALTAGVTLPFANTSINRMNGLDLGIEVGKRGTLDNNMIQQTFVNFRVGLNFADKWFQKRQYD